MTTKKNSKPAKMKQQTPSKFDQLLDACRSGQDVGWSELLAAWMETPPAPRSPDLVIKVIHSVGAK